MSAVEPFPPDALPRVLVVDDNAINRRLAEAMLRRAGCTVHVAEDAPSALALLETVSVDVVLSDIAMPGLDGRDFARRLREHPARRTLRLVAYTALAMEHQRAAILAAGFDAIAVKPVTRASLVRAVLGSACA